MNMVQLLIKVLDLSPGAAKKCILSVYTASF